MPLGKEKRAIQDKIDLLVYELRQAGRSDEYIAAILGMTKQGVWRSRKRHEDKLLTDTK